MQKLTPEQINETFKLLGLSTEEQREHYRFDFDQKYSPQLEDETEVELEVEPIDTGKVDASKEGDIYAGLEGCIE